MTEREKLPTTRNGTTHAIRCGKVDILLTVNTDVTGKPLEMFVKASEGYQGWADALALTASLAMQYGCPLGKILEKWRGMRFEPDGLKAFSVPDAIARKLIEQHDANNKS